MLFRPRSNEAALCIFFFTNQNLWVLSPTSIYGMIIVEKEKREGGTLIRWSCKKWRQEKGLSSFLVKIEQVGKIKQWKQRGACLFRLLKLASLRFYSVIKICNLSVGVKSHGCQIKICNSWQPLGHPD